MRRGLAAVEILVIVLVVVVLIAVLLPAMSATIKGGILTNCSNNLNQLMKAMYNYSISKSPTEGAFPTEPLGSEWWLILREHGEVDDWKLFACPVRAASKPGEIQYRGPSADPNPKPWRYVVGCDRPDNHLDSSESTDILNIVLKSGDVHKVHIDSEEWRKAMQDTRD